MSPFSRTCDDPIHALEITNITAHGMNIDMMSADIMDPHACGQIVLHDPWDEAGLPNIYNNEKLNMQRESFSMATSSMKKGNLKARLPPHAIMASSP